MVKSACTALSVWHSRSHRSTLNLCKMSKVIIVTKLIKIGLILNITQIDMLLTYQSAFHKESSLFLNCISTWQSNKAVTNTNLIKVSWVTNREGDKSLINNVREILWIALFLCSALSYKGEQGNERRSSCLFDRYLVLDSKAASYFSDGVSVFTRSSGCFVRKPFVRQLFVRYPLVGHF